MFIDLVGRTIGHTDSRATLDIVPGDSSNRVEPPDDTPNPWARASTLFWMARRIASLVKDILEAGDLLASRARSGNLPSTEA